MGFITISDQANRLFHATARAIGDSDLAIHVVWALNEGEDRGYWIVGFGPRSHYLAADEAG